MNKAKIIGAIIVIVVVAIVLIPSAPPKISTSDATFAQVVAATGCRSKNSSDKKHIIFNEQFKNHQMMWAGSVVYVGEGDVSIDINGNGVQDLSVTLKDKQQAVWLQRGQHITVQFVMQNAGGCVLDYSANEGVVIEENK